MSKALHQPRSSQQRCSRPLVTRLPSATSTTGKSMTTARDTASFHLMAREQRWRDELLQSKARSTQLERDLRHIRRVNEDLAHRMLEAQEEAQLQRQRAEAAERRESALLQRLSAIHSGLRDLDQRCSSTWDTETQEQPPVTLDQLNQFELHRQEAM